MPLTQRQAEIVARTTASSYENVRRDPGEPSDPRVSRALWQATMEAARRLAPLMEDETLLDIKPRHSYKASLKVSVNVTLLVATDKRLWIARHADGRPEEPLPVPYEAVRPVGKRMAFSTKVEQGPGGVTITGSRELADWLQTMQSQRPSQTASWLATAATSTSAQTQQAPAAWHPDPSGRHQHRYWDGSRWTERVSDDGVQSVDPTG